MDANRTDLSSAKRAVDLWAMALRRDAANYDALWKIARADYWLGRHVAEKERPAVLEDGVARGRAAAALAPARPEGHFWMAANMGAAAELSSRAGLRYRKTIKEELETVLRLDPGFLQGSADRALGRWYFKVPRLFGGSRKSAEEHLRASLKYHRTARRRISSSRSCCVTTVVASRLGLKRNASSTLPPIPNGNRRTRSSSSRHARCLRP